MSDTVGIVGLGQMGSAMAEHLLRAGFDVVGTDLVQQRRDDLEAQGGRTVDTPAAVAEEADRVVTSLPSAAALDAVMTGDDGLLSAARRPLTIIETSTLPLDVKERNHAAAEPSGAVLLDCPLSGTGAQARQKDIAVYASGDPAAVEACAEVFQGLSRAHFMVGEFGAGSKMKYLANLLVTIHNAAAAEAMVLGMKAGLDPDMIIEVISSGAGTSKMFEVRAPSMAANDYRTAGIAADVYQKDVRIIAEFAKSIQCPVPVFSQSGELHIAAVAQGHGQEDTAVVCAVLEQMAGLDRTPPTT